MGFDDDTHRCGECGIFVDAYNYHGSPDYIVTDYDIICKDCFLDNFEEYLDLFICNDDRTLPDYFDIDMLEKLGYQCIDNESCPLYHSELYDSMNDHPANIVASVSREFGFKLSDRYNYVWVISDSSSFHVAFQLFIKER